MSSRKNSLQLLAALGGLLGIVLICMVGFVITRMSTPPTAPDPIPATLSAPQPAQVDQPAQTATSVDLLKLVDVSQDTIKGTWTFDGTSLKTTAANSSQIEFPYRPPEEYDLSIRFQREQGNSPVVFVCTAGGTQFAWNMGGNDNHVAGFGAINGSGYLVNKTTQNADAWLTNGQPQLLVIKVRRDHLEVTLDSRFILNYATDYRGFTLWPGFRQHDDHTLGANVSNAITILAANVTEVAGHGKPVR